MFVIQIHNKYMGCGYAKTVTWVTIQNILISVPS